MQSGPTLVEVFVVPVEAVSAHALALLSAAERLRSSQMRSEAARHRFVSLRAGLRRLLSERLGCAPASVVISVPAGGAPTAPGSGWHFSLSHAPTCGVVALSRSGPLGIDIEADRQVQDAMRVASSFFHPAERQWLLSHRAQARSAAFLQLWVRKEAVVKACGQGLALRLDDWSVLSAKHQVEDRVDLELQAQVWRVHGLSGLEAHFMALTTRCFDAAVQLRHLRAGSHFVSNGAKLGVRNVRTRE